MVKMGGDLANMDRSIGRKTANWFRLLAKTRFMFYDFRERITFLLYNLGRWRMMVLRLLLRSLLISTRGEEPLKLKILIIANSL